MRRRPKPAKTKLHGKQSAPRKSPKTDDARVRDLETRLAEAVGQLQTRERQRIEAQEQQTATSAILRVISTSPIDAQPVFSAIAESVARLTGAVVTTVYEFDGSLVHLRAAEPSDYPHADSFRQNFPRPPAPDFAAGRVILDRTVLHRADLQNDPDTPELTRAWARRMDLRSVLWVPMLRGAAPIGVIGAVRREIGLFADDEVRLLQTFADQAVIAIENVRLFKELQARNRDLTEALDQQAATGEVLRAISSSPNDAKPVFDAMVRSARRLCDATYSAVYRLDGNVVHLVAHNHQKAEAVDEIGRAWPIPLSSSASVVVWAIREQTAIHTADVQAHLDFPSAALARARALDLRSMLVIPLVREGKPIGAIRVSRTEPTLFSDEQVALLQTFANQAAIAIENVRLFKELQGANRELSAASQHKSEFLANMSHELRTPLNAVIGFSEVLLQRMFGELNAKQDEYLKDIYASGQHLLSLINDILDLSKIEAGRMELAAAPFHLPSALENAVTLVRERAARHGIALHLDLDPGLGELVGDERKIKQVLLNLLSNAVKFTPEGGRITLRTCRRAGAVEIAVTDTGIGIAPEDQAAIFEEFRQVGRDEARKQEGTGLGLTLAKKFIELHGGRIWVESEVGQGSTFTFTLPVS